MSEVELEFVDPLGPYLNQLAVFSVTTGSVHVDLTAGAYSTLKAAIDGGRMITLKAEGDVYYRWSQATTGETVDEAMIATGGTPANQCDIIFAGEREDRRPPVNTLGIVIKAPVACKLRACISSRNRAGVYKP